MSLLRPTSPPYTAADWQRAPWSEQLRMASQAWVVQGYGAPKAIYGLYLIKIAFYIAMWWFFCSFSPGMGALNNISSWAFEAIAFKKAVLWSLAFEGLGIGSASGP